MSKIVIKLVMITIVMQINVFSASTSSNVHNIEQYKSIESDLINSIGIKFMDIPSGSFIMGTSPASLLECPEDDPFSDKDEQKECKDKLLYGMKKNELPAHKVNIHSFFMSATEITQLQYYQVMKINPSYFKTNKLGYDSRYNPVENVSWKDAEKFIKKLNQMEKTSKYRLPSEEEWEYATRATSSTKYFFGNNLKNANEYVHCQSLLVSSKTRSSERRKLQRKLGVDVTLPVAQKKPNKWGLYDTYGNVSEWTDSGYSEDYNSSRTYSKVFRGGSYSSYTFYSAKRARNKSNFKKKYLGFRIIKEK